MLATMRWVFRRASPLRGSDSRAHGGAEQLVHPPLQRLVGQPASHDREPCQHLRGNPARLQPVEQAVRRGPPHISGGVEEPGTAQLGVEIVRPRHRRADQRIARVGRDGGEHLGEQGVHGRGAALPSVDQVAEKAVEQGSDVCRILGFQVRSRLGKIVLPRGQAFRRPQPGPDPAARHHQTAPEGQPVRLDQSSELLLEGIDQRGTTFLPVLARHPGLVERGAEQAAQLLLAGADRADAGHLVHQLRREIRSIHQSVAECFQTVRLLPVPGALLEGGQHVRDRGRQHCRIREWLERKRRRRCTGWAYAASM